MGSAEAEGGPRELELARSLPEALPSRFFAHDGQRRNSSGLLRGGQSRVETRVPTHGLKQVLPRCSGQVRGKTNNHISLLSSDSRAGGVPSRKALSRLTS